MFKFRCVTITIASLAMLAGTCEAQTTSLVTVCPASTMTSARANAGTNYNLVNLRAWAKHPVRSGSTSSVNTDLVLVVAHRGNWEFCPENTLEAYEAAADLKADGDEMDLRISASGYDTAHSTYYPNGEAFLTHDYDLRGEAPDPGGTNDIIYTATPDQLNGRIMVDRHGNGGVDSNGAPILFHTLTDLLNNVLTRAQLLTGGLESGYTGNHGYKKVLRGAMLVLDIKGDDVNLTTYPNGTQLAALTEAMSEVNAFEAIHQIDLQPMIVYKIGYNKLTYAQWTSLITTYLSGAIDLPGLILIAYPENSTTRPSVIAQFENYPGYVMTNWNYRYLGISTAQWAIQDMNQGKGNSGFSSNNAFPEGFRKSDGSCCSDQPFNTYSLSAYDFLFQPANSTLFNPPSSTVPSVNATLQTIDTYQSAVNYLTVLNLRNIAHIQ